ncbi:MAG: heme exporter protein CcmD [Rhodobiaceae bacterium]|nr:MAG: heme exporter protein CcmD [Rhodobiaceae bacterium]
MAEFFEMGGYGIYLWPAFAIVTLVMVGLVAQSWYDLKTQRKLIAMLEAQAAERRS